MVENLVLETIAAFKYKTEKGSSLAGIDQEKKTGSDFKLKGGFEIILYLIIAFMIILVFVSIGITKFSSKTNNSPSDSIGVFENISEPKNSTFHTPNKTVSQELIEKQLGLSEEYVTANSEPLMNLNNLATLAQSKKTNNYAQKMEKDIINKQNLSKTNKTHSSPEKPDELGLLIDMYAGSNSNIHLESNDLKQVLIPITAKLPAVLITKLISSTKDNYCEAIITSKKISSVYQAKLIGNSSFNFKENRIYLSFNQIVMPNHSVYEIKAVAKDITGRVGLEGKLSSNSEQDLIKTVIQTTSAMVQGFVNISTNTRLGSAVIDSVTKEPLSQLQTEPVLQIEKETPLIVYFKNELTI